MCHYVCQTAMCCGRLRHPPSFHLKPQIHTHTSTYMPPCFQQYLFRRRGVGFLLDKAIIVSVCYAIFYYLFWHQRFSNHRHHQNLLLRNLQHINRTQTTASSASSRWGRPGKGFFVKYIQDVWSMEIITSCHSKFCKEEYLTRARDSSSSI